MKSIYQGLILDRPLLTILAVVAVTAALSMFLKNLYLDSSADSLVLENDESLAYYREIARRYETDDFLFITYRPGDDLFSEKNIQTIWQLRDELAGVAGVNSVVTYLDVPLFSGTPGSMAEKVRGAMTLRDPAMDRESARREFLDSPIYRDLLVSADGSTTALQVNLERDDRYYELLYRRNDLRQKKYGGELTTAEAAELDEVTETFRLYQAEASERRARLIASVRGIIDGYRDHAELFLGGVPMIAADMISFIRSDLRNFGTAMVIFLAGTLLFIFRKLRWTLWPMACAALVVVFMFGFLGLMKWPVTVISSNFVSLLLILCVSFTIHIIVRYQDVQAASPDAPQRDLVRETIDTISVPCLYSALTTLVAFVSLLISGIRPVIDFGLMMAMGIMVAFTLVFLVLPAAHMMMKKMAPVEASARASESTAFFARVTERHGGKIILFSLLLLAFCVGGVMQLKVENRFIDYFDESTEIYQGMVVIDANLGGTTPLDVILDLRADGPVEAPKENAAASPEDPFGADGAGPADPFAEDGVADDPFADDPLATGPVAGDPLAADPFADDVAGDLAGGDPFADDVIDAAGKPATPAPTGPAPLDHWFTEAGMEKLEKVHDYLDGLPESGKVMSLALLPKLVRELNNGKSLSGVELAFLKALMPDSVRQTLVEPFLSADGTQARVNLRVRESDPTLKRNELINKVEAQLVQETGLPAEQVTPTGVLVLYNNMLQSLFRSQILTLGFVFVAILAMFLVLFRSLYIGLIAMFPNLLAAGMVLGLMGWLGIPLDMMTITIAAITVGIAVDNTIHYVHRFRREFAARGVYLETMHACHASIGRAMYYVSITIIVGFSILMLSNFVPSVYFGLFTAMAMAVALLFSLTLLPRLLVTLQPLGPERAA